MSQMIIPSKPLDCSAAAASGPRYISVGVIWVVSLLVALLSLSIAISSCINVGSDSSGVSRRIWWYCQKTPGESPWDQCSASSPLP